MSWENIDKSRADSAHYSVMKVMHGHNPMDSLRAMFPDARADEMNFVLFSTSGVHGLYTTIEEAETNRALGVTFLVVHPRLVALRYGHCDPANDDDFAFLKALRKSSLEAMVQIGWPSTPAGAASESGPVPPHQ